MATVISGAADPQAPPPRWVRLRPPWLAQALVAAALMVHAALWGTGAPLGRWPATGILLALAGAAWCGWAAWTLRRAGTPIHPRAEPRVLVDEGPYRFGRHPMYLGLALTIGGVAIAFGSPLLLLAGVAFAAVVARVHVPFEEKMLRRRFGGWYSDYAADVRRWL
jgi:protein-S-isoprenylcysteine O-methyltransferase Ste14